MLNINLKGNEDFSKTLFFKFIFQNFFFISTNKMNNMKVPELKAEAKRLGLRGYSHIRKPELISLIAGSRTSPILDEINPEINSEILKPTKYVAPDRREAKQQKEEAKSVKREIRELEEMLGLRQRRIIPEIKVWNPEEENLHRKIKEINRRRLRITETVSALRGFARQFRIEGIPRHGPREFMQLARINILNLMRENRQTRVRMILTCEMTRKELFSENIQILNSFFHSETVENLEGTDESVIYNTFVQTIEERIQNFNQRGSNWRFQRVLSLDIHLTDFIPLRGSTFLPLPKKIATKKAVINIKNYDDQCFKWSVTRALHPVEKNSERITNILKHQSERLDWSGLKLPVDLNQIAIFEKFNPSISINVFGFDKTIYPLRISKTKRPRIVDLLLISDGEKQHYCLIKSLSRLLSSQLTKHDGSIVFCLNCLNHFPNEKKLKLHEEYCLKNEAIRIEIPEKGTFISFIHYNRSIKVSFVVYADFEAFTEEISTCEPNQTFSFIKKYKKHRPNGFCFLIVCFDKRFKSKLVVYRAKDDNEDIGQKFVEMLEEEIKRIKKEFDFSAKMIPLTKEEQYEFENASVCWICQKEFGESKQVRDHCHFTGKFRGAAHNICNLQFKKKQNLLP